MPPPAGDLQRDRRDRGGGAAARLLRGKAVIESQIKLAA
jgi:hypothetical protein